MLIDWFTVVAQIINFLILMGLLKYFLFDRMTSAMDKRRQDIDARFKEAEEKIAAAQEEKAGYEQKNKELEEQKAEILKKAREKARETEKSLTDEARSEADRKKKEWLSSLRQEKASFERQLKNAIVKEVYDVSKKALHDLAHADIEAEAATIFVRRIRDMDDRNIGQLFKNGNVFVRSRFQLSDQIRGQIESAFKERNGEIENIQFETDSHLLLGIEATGGGKKVAWSLNDYIESLEDKSLKIIEQKMQKDTEEAQDETISG